MADQALRRGLHDLLYRQGVEMLGDEELEALAKKANGEYFRRRKAALARETGVALSDVYTRALEEQHCGLYGHDMLPSSIGLAECNRCHSTIN